MIRRTLPSLLLAPALALGCAVPADDAADDTLTDDELASTEQALTGGLRFDKSIRPMTAGSAGRSGDWDGDGKADFFTNHVSGDRQIGVVGVKGSSLAASLAISIATPFDGVAFDPGYMARVGDVTGDGRADLLHMHSTAGLRVVQRRPDGTLSAPVRYPWGTRVDGWILAYENSFWGSADVDGDGVEELLVSSPWGFATFNVAADGRLSGHNMVERGRYLTGDRFYLDSLTQILTTGHFWGGNEELLLLRNSYGLGVALVPPSSSNPGNYISIEFAPWGQMQDGGWRIGSDNKIVGAGDIDGDGGEDFVLWSPWGLGVLETGDWFGGTTSFKTVAAFVWGTSVNGVPMNKAYWTNDPVDVVDDFNGDGRADIAINDDSGRLVVLGYDPATRTLKPLATLGKGQTASGGWVYDGSTPAQGRVARFGASDRASILEDSAWGMGILGISGSSFYVIAAAPYEIACGDGACNGGETCSTCSSDCGACPGPVCGNTVCEAGESCSTCSSDCGGCSGPTCGNGVCEVGETCSACEFDCGTNFQYCQFCPTAGTYNTWPLEVRACSLDGANTEASAAVCYGGYLQYGACPTKY